MPERGISCAARHEGEVEVEMLHDLLVRLAIRRTVGEDEGMPVQLLLVGLLLGKAL